MINQSVVPYFDKAMRVMCDRNCGKAWGINARPRVQLSDDPDDFAYLADDELDDAPVDPGTREGDVAKPLTPDDFIGVARLQRSNLQSAVETRSHHLTKKPAVHVPPRWHVATHSQPAL